MIEPQYCTIEKLFTDRVFRIPQYQRFYSWEKKQRDDLFKDVRQLFEKGEDRHHFMATVVCFKTSEIKPVGSREYRLFDIVDGQQRLTTLILLLKAIHLRLEDGEEKSDLGKILVKTDGQLILLQTNNSNQYLFETYLRTGHLPRKDQIKTHADKNLSSAIHECGHFLAKCETGELTLVKLLRLIRNRLGFVVYDTDDSRIVYSVFESLNSRGLPVDWLDKCKSVLMGQAFELAPNLEVGGATIDTLHSLWGNIYREISSYPIQGHEILRVASTINFGDEGGKPMKAETAIEELRNYCNLPEKTVTVSNWLFDVAKKLVTLRANRYWEPVASILQARVLAISIMLTQSLSEEERKQALDQWERVTFRIYGLFGKDSRSKVGEYVRLAKKIMSGAAGASRYSEIMKSLRELGKDHPIDSAVREVFRLSWNWTQPPLR